jgi:hypothetical protein
MNTPSIPAYISSFLLVGRMMLAVEIIFLHLIIKLPPFTTNNILLDNAVVIYKQQELQSDILNYFKLYKL